MRQYCSPGDICNTWKHSLTVTTWGGGWERGRCCWKLIGDTAEHIGQNEELCNPRPPHAKVEKSFSKQPNLNAGIWSLDQHQLIYVSKGKSACWRVFLKIVLNFQDISKYNMCFENEFVDGLGAGEVKF